MSRARPRQCDDNHRDDVDKTATGRDVSAT